MFRPFKLIDKTNNLNASTSTSGLRVNSTLGPSQKQYKSLVFNSVNSQYFSRTPASAGSQTTWTMSIWVKRSKLGASQAIFSAGTSSITLVSFQADDTLRFRGSTVEYATTQVFRDVSAWSHFVFRWDSSNATAANRLKIYHNGSEITSYSTQTNAGSSEATIWNSAVSNQIGRYAFNGTSLADLYLTEINFIDGQALGPENFGYFDAIGIWQPKRFSGLYGTNGFYLPLNDSSFIDLVKDKSGNGNNWTLNGYSSTSISDAVVSDSSINNFCSLNPLSITSGVFSRGNSRYTGPSSWRRANSNISVSSGKWYWEVILGNAPFSNASGSAYNAFGWGLSTVFNSSTGPGSITDGIVLGDNQYYKNFANAWLSLGVTFSSGDVLSCAIDLEENIFNFYRNGLQLVSGTIGGTIGRELTPVIVSYDGTYGVMDCNFGQKPFRYLFPSVYKRYANFTTGMLSQSGLSAYTPATIIDNDISTIGFHTDAAGIGSFLQFDLGAGVSKNFRRIRIQGYKATVSGVRATWDVEYSDDGSSWTKAFTGINMETIGTNELGGGNGYFTAIRDWSDLGAHRYWRIYKTNAAAGGDYHQGVDFYEIDSTSSFKSICTANLPIPSITKGNNFMDVVTYTGNGSGQTFSGLNFSPDLVWIKNRTNGYNHVLFDSIRGTGGSKVLFSNRTTAEGGGVGEEGTIYGHVNSFNLNGFSVANGTGTPLWVSNNGDNYVAWSWDAGSTTNPNNTAGTITSSVRANPIAGFSIVSYTGNTSTGTVGHGLGIAPKMIIIKNRISSVDNWQVYHSALSNTQRLRLNTTDLADSPSPGMWNSTSPTTTVFSVGNQTGVNSATTYIAYCFSEIEGYSKFGSFAGNNSTDGPFIYCGFRPKFIMVKKTSATGPWMIYDSQRDLINVGTTELRPNEPTAEPISTRGSIDFLSNGFKIRSTSSTFLGELGDFIFAAFAEHPFKYSRAR